MKRVLFILGVLDDDDVDWLITHGHRCEMAAGEVLIHERHPIEAIYLVLEGALEVSIAALGHQPLASLSSGEVVGEMSFVDKQLPSATVTATETSLLLKIPTELLTDKLENDVWFASRFYRALAILLSSRLRGTVKQLQGDQWKPIEISNQNYALGIEDEMAVASVRFDWLLRRFRDNPAPAIETSLDAD